MKDEGRRLAASLFKGWDLSDRRISDVHLDVVREEAGGVLFDKNPLERHGRALKRCGLRDVSASPGKRDRALWGQARGKTLLYCCNLDRILFYLNSVFLGWVGRGERGRERENSKTLFYKDFTRERGKERERWGMGGCHGVGRVVEVRMFTLK